MADTRPDDAVRIQNYLTELGWPAIALGPAAWRSSFRNKNTTFPLVIHLEDGWCKLLVLPIVRLPADPEKAEKLYERLLRLNGALLLARFSIDEDGDVVLSVEFPTSDLDSSELRDALDVLSYYADRHQSELRQLVA